MKPILLLLLTCLVCLGQEPGEWRTFTSPDGSKTFEGQLTAYDEVSEKATVRTKAGATIEFELDRVSDEDREYIETHAKDLPVSIKLDVRFEKIMERTSSSSTGGTRNATYEGGYKILIKNFTPTSYMDVDVDYIVVYRKDQVSGSGTDQITNGSDTIDLLANTSTEVVAGGVQLSSYFKKGQSTSGGGGCRTCPRSGGTSIPSQRSRDYLIGCIALIKINGQVVQTSATSPSVLRKYGKSLGVESSASAD